MPYARVAGDAGCFIDPFFSSGVHLAMMGRKTEREIEYDCDCISFELPYRHICGKLALANELGAHRAALIRERLAEVNPAVTPQSMSDA